MRHFLGLVPPDGFTREVVAWQASLGHRITTPHVTVKAPDHLTPDRRWLPDVERACASHPPVEVTLTGVRTFGRRVVYLGVQGEGLRDLHLDLVGAVGAPLAPFEGRRAFTPHLTLVLSRAPLGVSFDEALARATETFTTPVTFHATFVRLFRKPSPGGTYEVDRDLPLGRGALVGR
ncbi:2'-5' RNA ligase family protein [Deinococcus pimensis]|uniref:2'-5' RNA ligase family protein n=1 Tax=Deinococcus pimensis TaxID=309888 RepID=UPI0004888DE7|nr:2'-5' RNA ligase family protein [Deinococcus pimensis]